MTTIKWKPMKWKRRRISSGDLEHQAETIIGLYRLRRLRDGDKWLWWDITLDGAVPEDVGEGLTLAAAKTKCVHHYQQRLTSAVEWVE